MDDPINIKEHLEKLKNEISSIIHNSDSVNYVMKILKERGYDIELKFLFTILGNSDDFNKDGILNDEIEPSDQDLDVVDAQEETIKSEDKEINDFDKIFMKQLGIKWESYGGY